MCTEKSYLHINLKIHLWILLLSLTLRLIWSHKFSATFCHLVHCYKDHYSINEHVLWSFDISELSLSYSECFFPHSKPWITVAKIDNISTNNIREIWERKFSEEIPKENSNVCWKIWFCRQWLINLAYVYI